MSREALAVNSIALEFDGQVLFENLTHVLETGKNLLITGRNGSGKSSFLKILAGELAASSGSYRISDPIYMPASPTNPGFAKIDEYFQLTGSAWVRDSYFYRVVHNQIYGKSMSALSSGEFKSAALARVLTIAGTTYLLDEPTVSLDKLAISLLAEEIKTLNKLGCSFMIATNNVDDFSEIDYELFPLEKDYPRPM